MAKRKITVTVDEELVDQVQALGGDSLSAVVNRALGEEVDRRARNAALRRLLAEWDEAFGPVSDTDLREARAILDEADGIAPPAELPESRPSKPARRRRSA